MQRYPDSKLRSQPGIHTPASGDRRWLEPLIGALFSEITAKREAGK